MTGPKDTICFTCGQAIQDPPRFNLLASGDYCPTCQERVLDAAPSLLPGGTSSESTAESTVDSELEASMVEPVEEELEQDGDDYPGPPAA